MLCAKYLYHLEQENFEWAIDVVNLEIFFGQKWHLGRPLYNKENKVSSTTTNIFQVIFSTEFIFLSGILWSEISF